ncbi:hypothetical protein BDV36DRAFT_298829 [Aspergillus pseudocaelatus]|uniref:Uncharacterized protein n=1 Tax=Aspergillus pseudocaelatus TaxID=1825620 RepID=A0ABQ6WBU8_9EURO|nr:hypothetical protein BDV36DRAFT_298829 [Aspergillus pseudocaelatus]
MSDPGSTMNNIDSVPEQLQPWKAHWPQSTMSTAHLDPKKFARALGGRKGASPNQDSFVDGTKAALNLAELLRSGKRE